MSRTRMTVLVAAIVAASLSTAASGAATKQQTFSQRMRATIAQQARRAHIDVNGLLRMKTTVTSFGTDGTLVKTRRTLADVIDHIGPSFPVSSHGRGSGPGGTPEVLAGNTLSIFGGFWAGSTSDAEANCPTASVTTSSTVPSTPFAPVTLAPLYLTPVPGALSPVIPATSWLLPAYSAGGATLHVKASYKGGIGLHTAGTLLGSGASTASGAPAPYPVWLPMVSTMGFIDDQSIDFVGHALGAVAGDRFDLLGFTACFVVGALPLTDGVAVFDNHKVLGLNVGLPDVP